MGALIGDRRGLEFEDAELRAVGGDDEARAIEGYAAVFNKPSEVLGHGFVEVLQRGAFDGTDFSSMVALFNHVPSQVLGVPELTQDNRGLHYRVEDSGTFWFNEAWQGIKSGAVKGNSFAFISRSKERGDDMNGDKILPPPEGTQLPIRKVLKGGIKAAYDVGPATYPAYRQTTVEARCVEVVKSCSFEAMEHLEAFTRDLTMANEALVNEALSRTQ